MMVTAVVVRIVALVDAFLKNILHKRKIFVPTKKNSMVGVSRGDFITAKESGMKMLDVWAL